MSEFFSEGESRLVDEIPNEIFFFEARSMLLFRPIGSDLATFCHYSDYSVAALGLVCGKL